jgi:hypothetical protein
MAKVGDIVLRLTWSTSRRSVMGGLDHDNVSTSYRHLLQTRGPTLDHRYCHKLKSTGNWRAASWLSRFELTNAGEQRK